MSPLPLFIEEKKEEHCPSVKLPTPPKIYKKAELKNEVLKKSSEDQSRHFNSVFQGGTVVSDSTAVTLKSNDKKIKA